MSHLSRDVPYALTPYPLIKLLSVSLAHPSRHKHGNKGCLIPSSLSVRGGLLGHDAATGKGKDTHVRHRLATPANGLAVFELVENVRW